MKIAFMGFKTIFIIFLMPLFFPNGHCLVAGNVEAVRTSRATQL